VLTVLAIGLPGFLAVRALPHFSSQAVIFAERQEILTKLVLCALVTLLVALYHWRGARIGARRASVLLSLVATLSVAAHFNFGLFHGKTFVHHWEQFHYTLGSKYFPELGYDGLYVASIGAQADLSPTGRMQVYARDLRTYRVDHIHELIPHMQEVYQRFSPERWEAFFEDNRFFALANHWDYIAAIRRDHGFNGTPTWIFVARLFDSWLPISEGTLTVLGLLDLVLLAAAFTAVFRTYGASAGCLSLVVFGLGYPGRFSWLGGAFLRFDWLVALVFALCALKRARYMVAGTLFGYATMVRLFPVLFLFGPALLATKAFLRGERPRWAFQLAIGFASAVFLGLVVGSATGRGFQAWTAFAGNIQLHADTFLTNNVGLSNLVLYDRAIMERQQVDWTLPEPWLYVQDAIRARKEERQVPLRAAQLTFLLLLAAALWRAPLTEAALAGMVAVFSLGALTCYYWALLLLAPLSRSRLLLFGTLLLNLGMYVVHLLHPAFEMRYGLMSWGLALLFLAWVLPDAVKAVWPRVRREGVSRSPDGAAVLGLGRDASY
jgi:hypothetical protein